MNKLNNNKFTLLKNPVHNMGITRSNLISNFNFYTAILKINNLSAKKMATAKIFNSCAIPTKQTNCKSTYNKQFFKLISSPLKNLEWWLQSLKPTKLTHQKVNNYYSLMICSEKKLLAFFFTLSPCLPVLAAGNAIEMQLAIAQKKQQSFKALTLSLSNTLTFCLLRLPPHKGEVEAIKGAKPKKKQIVKAGYRHNRNYKIYFFMATASDYADLGTIKTNFQFFANKKKDWSSFWHDTRQRPINFFVSYASQSKRLSHFNFWLLHLHPLHPYGLARMRGVRGVRDGEGIRGGGDVGSIKGAKSKKTKFKLREKHYLSVEKNTWAVALKKSHYLSLPETTINNYEVGRQRLRLSKNQFSFFYPRLLSPGPFVHTLSPLKVRDKEGVARVRGRIELLNNILIKLINNKKINSVYQLKKRNEVKLNITKHLFFPCFNTLYQILFRDGTEKDFFSCLFFIYVFCALCTNSYTNYSAFFDFRPPKKRFLCVKSKKLYCPFRNGRIIFGEASNKTIAIQCKDKQILPFSDNSQHSLLYIYEIALRASSILLQNKNKSKNSFYYSNKYLITNLIKKSRNFTYSMTLIYINMHSRFWAFFSKLTDSAILYTFIRLSFNPKNYAFPSLKNNLFGCKKDDLNIINLSPILSLPLWRIGMDKEAQLTEKKNMATTIKDLSFYAPYTPPSYPYFPLRGGGRGEGLSLKKLSPLTYLARFYFLAVAENIVLKRDEKGTKLTKNRPGGDYFGCRHKKIGRIISLKTPPFTWSSFSPLFLTLWNKDRARIIKSKERKLKHFKDTNFNKFSVLKVFLNSKTKGRIKASKYGEIRSLSKRYSYFLPLALAFYFDSCHKLFYYSEKLLIIKRILNWLSAFKKLINVSCCLWLSPKYNNFFFPPNKSWGNRINKNTKLKLALFSSIPLYILPHKNERRGQIIENLNQLLWQLNKKRHNQNSLDWIFKKYWLRIDTYTTLFYRDRKKWLGQAKSSCLKDAWLLPKKTVTAKNMLLATAKNALKIMPCRNKTYNSFLGDLFSLIKVKKRQKIFWLSPKNNKVPNIYMMAAIKNGIKSRKFLGKKEPKIMYKVFGCRHIKNRFSGKRYYLYKLCLNLKWTRFYFSSNKRFINLFYFLLLPLFFPLVNIPNATIKNKDPFFLYTYYVYPTL
jgi:hypothetical protein